jgi:hypothetical protein
MFITAVFLMDHAACQTASVIPAMMLFFILSGGFASKVFLECCDALEQDRRGRDSVKKEIFFMAQ